MDIIGRGDVFITSGSQGAKNQVQQSSLNDCQLP